MCLLGQNRPLIYSLLLSCRKFLLHDELGKEDISLWAMETRMSLISAVQETQHLSQEKGQSPANGNREQFDSGELLFSTPVSL